MNQKAIIHIDADAFFASCEQAMNPAYKGKPVVVGADRGIATAFSYEAKARGVRRGMLNHEIKKICPEAILLPGDYEAYSLFSKRLFAILRRFTDRVEEYSIDEGFVDITDLNTEGISYEKIAASIKETIERELDLSVSVGLAPTKVLAKLASTCNKPNGFAVISQKDLPEYLRDFLVDKIWGVGVHTAEYMRRLNIFSAYDFAIRPLSYVQQYFAKPHQEVWQELNGTNVYPVIAEDKHAYASISKTSTFTYGRHDEAKVYAELVQNIENACAKARKYHIAAKRVSIFLKSEAFDIEALEVDLVRASGYPTDIINVVKPMFTTLYRSGTGYRATGVVLSQLTEQNTVQGDLFESPGKLDALKNIYEAVDNLATRFGKHTVRSGGALRAEVSKKRSWHLPLISLGVVH